MQREEKAGNGSAYKVNLQVAGGKMERYSEQGMKMIIREERKKVIQK